MLPPTLLIILYCVMIVAASLLGGLLPSILRLTHLRMQVIMSLVSGLMLGVAIIHMLPHAAMRVDSFLPVAYSMLGGVVVMFFLLRVFHVHHHTDPDHSRCDHDHADHPAVESVGGDPHLVTVSEHDHAHEHVHDHSHSHGHAHDHSHSHDDAVANLKLPSRFSWQGLFVGLAIHTLIDGVALAASVRSESGGGMTFLGLGTFLAVMLHKPLDAMSITSLMRARGTSMENQMLVNCGFAMACPLGAILAWSSLASLGGSPTMDLILSCSLGFSAGFFLCIALGDLLPEVQFHSHDRGKLTVALLLGLFIAIAIEALHTHP
ncbi:ZIP family metal transporter [Rosistilla oblonga]|uniref:Zinc transporter ZupT n=1 Tax=Rosistilla oblonga TaxID=2527990 RepID=A0A518IWY7_9BACT|nr:ZIP family metal transporter [Rosistilla oblonga]QDV57585.1 zinc transporter ZupT [Rosistilla oblonga]